LAGGPGAFKEPDVVRILHFSQPFRRAMRLTVVFHPDAVKRLPCFFPWPDMKHPAKVKFSQHALADNLVR
jgi:hypothetical protein